MQSDAPWLRSLVGDLRTATTRAHERLDARLSPTGDRAIDVANYTRLLRAMSAVVLPLEGPLAIHLGPLFVHESRGERHRRLAHDLSLLGVEPADAWPSLPPVGQLAEAYGACYVILASQVGGQVIARSLFGRDTTGRDTPDRYLRMYGGQLADVWTRFVQATDVFGTTLSTSQRQSAVSTAIALFTAFDLALDREALPRVGVTTR